ncbi:hypothetical protein VTI74DRAFT_8104 [Chaetomium olivicolor]
MASPRAARIWASFSLAILLCSTAMAQQQLPDKPSVPMKYCATANTADMVPIYWNWQSDGRCFGNCTDLKFALAIVQGKNCWCSNLIPNSADQKPLKDCEAPCPGYPSDYCGGDGTFGYMEVGGFTPTGTAAGGAAPSSTQGTTTNPPPVQTVTVGGIVKTVTATPTPTKDAATTGSSGGGLQTGAIVGIVIGAIGGLAVIGAFLWLLFVRRRRQQEGDNGLGSPTRGGSSPGMMATPKTEISEGRFATAGAGTDSGWDTSTKRRSHLMPVDPRLDPFATGLYSGDQNRSRESLNSLQDNQDYSRRVHQAPRVLRATNPDPDDDD